MEQKIECCGNCYHYIEAFDNEGWCSETQEFVNEQNFPKEIDCKYFEYKKDEREY